jgi:hypothetical protein
MITPEGVCIYLETTVGGWTADSIYALLQANAYQLDVIGSHLAIYVQTTWGTQTATGVACCDASGNYYGYQAAMYLNPSKSFGTYPDYGMAHEYGAAWSQFWMYMNPTNQGSFANWEIERGIYGNPLLYSSFSWSPNEMLADDYRLLFGDTASQNMAYINPDIPDPRTVPGLKNWLTNNWA